MLDTPGTHELAVRVGAELRELGFTVTFERATSAPSLGELQGSARRLSATAVLHLERSERGIQVWAWDRSTNKLVLRELLSTEGSDVGELALRAVEVLRASLLETQDPPPHTPLEPSPPPVQTLLHQTTHTRPSPWTARVETGLLGSISPGGMSPLLHVPVALGVESSQRWSAGLELLAPVLEGSVREREGQTSLLTVFTSAWGFVRLTPSSWRFESSLGLGVALAWLQLRGVPAPGYEGVEASGLTALPWARARIAWRFTARAALLLELRGGLTVQPQQVYFAERLVATWGAPWLALGTGLSVHLP